MALSSHNSSLDPEKLAAVCTVDDDQSLASSSCPCKCAIDSNSRRASGGWKAAGFILSMELCERLATLGIGLNLVTYLHDIMHLPIPRSANIVTNFLGTSYLTCLLGGFIADSYLGRYCTIAIGSCIQLLGIILMALSSSVPSLKPTPCEEGSQSSACKEASREQLTILYIALYMMAFGTGGIKSSVSGLGADQFEDGHAKGRQHMQSYFNWFGMAMAVASMVAVTVLVYVQDNQGRGVGYGACAGCMAIALALFLGGTRFYRSKPPAGSALTQIARVLVAAWLNRHLPLPRDPSHLYHHGHAWIHAPSSSSSSSSSSYPHHHHAPQHDPQSSSTGFCSATPFRHTNQFLFLDKASLMPQNTNIFKVNQNPWRLSSLEHVEEVKMFFRLFPILGTTIVFWTANAQMLTFSIEQGATLNRNLGGNFDFPPASLVTFVQIGMLLTIPFYDRVLLPLARKWRGDEHGITSLQRIGVGLVFSIFSMVVAALVERKRLHIAHNNISTRNANVLPMSIFYLAPQYALVGIGDAFAYIGQLEFFFTESPHGMRSLGTGLCFSSVSCGFFLSGALVSGINRWTKHGSTPGWLANNLNIGRLDYFYLLLAFSSLLSFLAYLLCSHWFESNRTWIMNTSHQEESICNDKAMQVGKFIDK